MFSRLQVITFVITLFLLSACAENESSNNSAFEPAVAKVKNPPSGSGTYEQLVALFEEIRELREPAQVDGIDDYSDEAIEAKITQLPALQARLADMNVANWSKTQQVDYLVVRSQFDQMSFDLQVHRPWARDPGFYVDRVFRVTFTELPVEGEDLDRFTSRMESVPKILEAAKVNLDEAATDYVSLAIRNLTKTNGVQFRHPFRDTPPPGVLGWYDDILARARTNQADLVPVIESAKNSVQMFHDWLVANQEQLNASAGIGYDTYKWYVRNVKMMPYSPEDLLALGGRELQRTSAYLALERNQNRNLPELQPAATEEEYAKKRAIAHQRIRQYIRDNAFMSLPPEAENISLVPDASWTVRSGPSTFWEAVQYRDSHPNYCHVIVPGHRFDGLLARMNEHPIRSTYWDGGRVEGWATYAEESLMQSGLVDDIPRAIELFYIMQMKRASRVYVDVMMQLNKMTVAEATQYMIDHVPLLDESVSRVDAEIYIRRPPGYGIGYTIGKTQIEKLLADRSRQLGDAFSLLEFHDAFHTYGRIPVSLIRYEMTGFDDEVRNLWAWDPLRVE